LWEGGLREFLQGKIRRIFFMKQWFILKRGKSDTRNRGGDELGAGPSTFSKAV